jgi:hypothetical protein
LHFPTLPCPGVSKPLPTMAFVSWLHLTVWRTLSFNISFNFEHLRF